MAIASMTETVHTQGAKCSICMYTDAMAVINHEEPSPRHYTTDVLNKWQQTRYHAVMGRTDAEVHLLKYTGNKLEMARQVYIFWRHRTNHK
jgi:hypothetical protein